MTGKIVANLKGRTKDGRAFWCDVLHQQVLTRACIAYYKKGKAQCAGCEIGRALVVAEISHIKAGASGRRATDDGQAL